MTATADSSDSTHDEEELAKIQPGRRCRRKQRQTQCDSLPNLICSKDFQGLSIDHQDSEVWVDVILTEFADCL